MRKLAVIVILLLMGIAASAQHEGIRRYFSSYTLNNDTTTDMRFYNDTTLDEFYKFMPQQKVSDNTLGLMNPGNPYLPAIFSKKQGNHDFYFLNNYQAFIKSHNDVVYFDAQKPFTRFDFTGGTKGLEILKFIHSQNFTPYFNLTFNYDISNSNGFYLNSASKVNALYLAGAFTKKKYQNHFNFIFNKINSNENGGIANIDRFERGEIRAVDNNVLLTKASSSISQLGGQYNHEYRFGQYTIDTIIRDEKNDTVLNKNLHSKFSIVHDVTFDRYIRKYNDIASSFYTNYYNDSSKTLDSTTYYQFNNKLLFCLNIHDDSTGNQLKLYAGLKNKLYAYNIDSTYKRLYNSTYITGNLLLKHNKTDLQAEADYCVFGSDAFDLNVTASLRQMFGNYLGINAKAGYSLCNASVFDTYYASNNFKWENGFKKNGLATAHLDLFYNKFHMSVGANLNLLHNYIIYDYQAMPTQINKANLIVDVYINKTFNFWKFHWANEVAYQYISDKQYVRLPNVVGYTSLYFMTGMFSNALTLQIGLDAKMNSNIYGYAYMPATSVFYLQDDKKFGFFPNLGVFVGAKIKRFRIFAKLSNYGSLFMKPTYFSLYRLPDNPLAFNFGISWEFYD
ncbi:MAG: hypothetical protein J6T63_00325 [Bacteroidales bacterium]|nr:hypothetical protein [Bacteroidales bacterium]